MDYTNTPEDRKERRREFRRQALQKSKFAIPSGVASGADHTTPGDFISNATDCNVIAIGTLFLQYATRF